MWANHALAADRALHYRTINTLLPRSKYRPDPVLGLSCCGYAGGGFVLFDDDQCDVVVGGGGAGEVGEG